MVVVGKIGAAYGVKGWVRISSFTVPADNILRYEPWYVRSDGDWGPLAVDGAKRHQKGVVAHVDGIDDRTAIERYRGLEIGVAEDTLPAPEKNEYYWNDLVGLRVQNNEGATLGEVVRLIETGAHDVLVIEGEAGQILVPFVRQIVTSVDLDAGRMIAEWQADY
jgi:16S rRNA processing protein RimM